MKEIKAIIDKIIFTQHPSFNSVLDEHGLSIDYTRQINTIRYYFSINYVKQYDEVYFSNTVVYYAIFIELNQILSEIIGKSFNLNEMTVVNYPSLQFDNSMIFNSPEKPIVRNYNSLQPMIDNEQITLIGNNILEFLNINTFPFFSRVSSLQVVNDEIIDKVPQMELGNYIPGRFMNAKVLIIMKLCGNPRYEEYRNWAIGAYKKGVELNPDRYLEDYKIVIATIEYLDSGKYKELV